MKSEISRMAFRATLGLLLLGIVLIGICLWNVFYLQGEGNEEVFLPAFFSDQAPPQTVPVASAPREWSFAFVFSRGEAVKSLDILSPKFSIVTESLGYKAKIDACLDESEIVRKVENRQVFVGAVSAVTFAKSRKKHKIKAFLERAGKNPKVSLFLIRNDSPVQRLDQLRGKKIAFKGRDSLSGYVLPLEELASVGLRLNDSTFTEIVSGNYENSIHGLLQKEYDCAVISSTFYDELEPEKQGQLKVLFQSKAVPGGVYITSVETDDRLLQSFSEAFQTFGKDMASSRELSGFFRVKAPDMAMYDLLEKDTSDGEK